MYKLIKNLKAIANEYIEENFAAILADGIEKELNMDSTAKMIRSSKIWLIGPCIYFDHEDNNIFFRDPISEIANNILQMSSGLLNREFTSIILSSPPKIVLDNIINHTQEG